MSDFEHPLDDFQVLNNLISSNYNPANVSVETPTADIWKSMSEDNNAKNAILSVEKTTKRYEAPTNVLELPAPASAPQPQRQAYPSYSGYSPTSGYNTYGGYTTYRQVESSQTMIERDFDRIRTEAYKAAEQELSERKVSDMKPTNPQLKHLGRRRISVNIGWLKRGALITGAFLAKSVAMTLEDIRLETRRKK